MEQEKTNFVMLRPGERLHQPRSSADSGYRCSCTTSTETINFRQRENINGDEKRLSFAKEIRAQVREGRKQGSCQRGAARKARHSPLWKGR
jgi:hypothetical protein